MKGEVHVKKKLSALCAFAVLSSFTLIPDGNVQALEVNDNPVIEAKEEYQFKYFQVSGTISSITEKENGSFFATIDSKENPFGFYFNEDTFIFDNSGNAVKLKEGMQITAYVDSLKPMIMIYPPQYSPDVVIVQTDNPGTVQLDQFDQNYLNVAKDLIIHLNEKSNIMNLSGEKLSKEDVIDKEVLIFYEVVLESYPAQTGPSKVIVLERNEQWEQPSEIEKAYQIAENDFYIVNNVKMVPLRLIAEQLGYRVDSTGVGAIVSKGEVSFTITRGTKSYITNGTTKQFVEAPALLEPRKTYVPYEFIEELVGNF